MNRLSRALVVGAALAVATMLVTPLWTVHLGAPQYPEGLGMTIHINTVRGASEFDLMKINQLNHYIGMKVISPDAIPELKVMPWIVAALAVAGLAVAAMGRRRWLMVWLGLRRGGHRRFLAVGIRLRSRPRLRERHHQGAGNDVPAAADRHEAAVELHGNFVAVHRRNRRRARNPSRRGRVGGIRAPSTPQAK